MRLFPLRLAGLLAVLVQASGCGWPPPRSPLPWEERRLEPLSTSRIHAQGRHLGRLREFGFPDPLRPTRLWLVENEHGQWVGWIDEVGRVFKLSPHERDGRHVGTGSVALCLQILFALPGPPTLSAEWRAEAP